VHYLAACLSMFWNRHSSICCSIP